MNFTYDFAKIHNNVPMIEFLESLSIKERAKIFASIDKLIELKNHGMQPKENLSSGFIKKSQKTPKREIEKARSIRRFWRETP